MTGRLRKRSGMGQDLQNWLGSGIQIKVGGWLQDVLKMAAKMFSVQMTYYRHPISMMEVKNYTVTAAVPDLIIILSTLMVTQEILPI